MSSERIAKLAFQSVYKSRLDPKLNSLYNIILDGDNIMKPEDIEINTFYSGLHRTNCGVIIKHIPTGIQEGYSLERSAHANKEIAYKKLEERLKSVCFLKPMQNVYDIQCFTHEEIQVLFDLCSGGISGNGCLVPFYLEEVEDYNPEAYSIFKKYNLPDEFKLYVWW